MFIILAHSASWRYPTTKVDVPQLPEQKGGFHTRTACPNVTCTLSNLTCVFFLIISSCSPMASIRGKIQKFGSNTSLMTSHLCQRYLMKKFAEIINDE